MEQWLEDWKTRTTSSCSPGPRSTNVRAPTTGTKRAVLEGDTDDPCFDRKQRELARTRGVLTRAAHRSPAKRVQGLGAQEGALASHRYAAPVRRTDRILRPTSPSGGAARSAARMRAGWPGGSRPLDTYQSEFSATDSAETSRRRSASEAGSAARAVGRWRRQAWHGWLLVESGRNGSAVMLEPSGE
jgi:hypothetical protein